MGDIALHPIVLDTLKQTGSTVFDYGGIFTIGVYAGNLRLGTEIVSIDDNLVLTITSSRPDQVYHLMISETTQLQVTTLDWDSLLIKYRYFFPLTIERSLNELVKRGIFTISTDNKLLNLISRLWNTGHIKTIMSSMVSAGECTNEIYGYTQNTSQLADFLCYTPSMRRDYAIPTGTDTTSVLIQQYYATDASVSGRSLLVAFLEQCLIAGYITLNDIPAQYIAPNTTVFPYAAAQGGFYGFNTPLRVLHYNVRGERHT
jgi:hypothetical protein